MLESLNNKAYNIANLFFYIYKERFISVRYEKGKKWYEFNGNIWVQEDATLYDLISTELPEKYKIVKKYYEEQLKETNDEKIKKNIFRKIEKIQKQIDSLSDTYMKHNIVTEAENIFYLKNKGIEDLLDTKYNLIGFENGIFDLEKMEFRRGVKDDYITISTRYNYIETSNSNIKKQILQFFEDIIPKKEEREYVLIYLSTALIGKNDTELFTIMTGIGGRNGKSKLAELLLHTLGDYYYQGGAEFLTKERPSPSSPQPDLIDLMNRRLVILSEPKDKLNTSFIKILTGRDQIRARKLYGNEYISFKPGFKIALLCNDMPNIDMPQDIAFWKRCRCINFPTEFTEHPIRKNEKLINKKLDEILPLWKEEMMLLLIEYYKKYNLVGLIPTNDILKFTKKYIEQVNPLEGFCNKYITKTNKDSDKLIWSDLYQVIEKHKDELNITMGKNKIKEYLENKFFKQVYKKVDSTNRGWLGYLFDLDLFKQDFTCNIGNDN